MGHWTRSYTPDVPSTPIERPHIRGPPRTAGPGRLVVWHAWHVRHVQLQHWKPCAFRSLLTTHVVTFRSDTMPYRALNMNTPGQSVDLFWSRAFCEVRPVLPLGWAHGP